MIGPFFASSAEPLAAEKLFNFGPLPITNTMLFGLITALFVLILFGLAARASQVWPKSRFGFWFESLVELVLGLITDSFGDRKKALRFFPLLMTLLVFILVSNLSGLLPGVGSLTYHSTEGNISFLRAFTTDINSTLAMAVLSIGTVLVYAFSEIGFRAFISHHFPRPLWNPFNIFLGLMEFFSEAMRLVTLSLRLFGVIYGGEALLHAITELSGNLAPVATVPIMFLEIFVALVQAYLFMMLTTSYLVMAVPEEHEQQPVSAKAVEAK
jgi:F-type H+-transporting ATPase subunit a